MSAPSGTVAAGLGYQPGGPMGDAVCLTCGAVVADQRLHDDWHNAVRAAIEQVLITADRALSYHLPIGMRQAVTRETE